MAITLGLATFLWARHHYGRRDHRRHIADHELQNLNRFDPLTGLVNQAALAEIMHHLPNVASGSHISVVTIEFDCLNAIRRLHGPIAHGMALAVLARRLRRLLSPMGVIGRLEADRFGCVVLHGPDTTGPADLIAAMQGAIAAPIDLPGGTIVVHGSIGIDTSARADFLPDTAMERAVHAMTLARKRGCPPRREVRSRRVATPGEDALPAISYTIAKARRRTIRARFPLAGA